MKFNFPSVRVGATLLLGQLGFAGVGLCAARAHLAAPTDLLTEGQSHPLAVAAIRPALSWKVVAASPDLHGVSQTSYEIRISDDASFAKRSAHVLWDSGKVRSSSSAVSLEAGATLSPDSHHDYAWQVRVWDEKDVPTRWSQRAYWSQAPRWSAQWIAEETTDASADNKPMPIFRKSLRLDNPIRRAVLYVSGLGQYEFRINGRKVGEDELTPGWSDYRKLIYYDTYDVTPMLRTGVNALGILIGNGMYRVPKTPGRYTKFNGSFGPPKCIIQLHITFANGRTLTVTSDRNWKSHPGPIRFSNTYGGEDYDAREEPAGWDKPGFDDSSWSAVQITDGPGGTLSPEVAPPIRAEHTYPAVHVTLPKRGVIVYDLGQNFAGWPVIRVSGPAGTTVKLIPGELLNADGTVSQRSSGEPQWFSYTLKGSGIEEWHPRFSYYGFRYVQVEGANTASSVGTRKPHLLSLHGEAVHSSSRKVGTFLASDELLNRIHTLIVRAIENNAESLFTDCPHREKLGWLEETHLLASAMLYDFDFRGLYAATARNIADAQTAKGPNAGRVPEIAPQYTLFDPQWGIFDDSPEWGSAAVLAPWYLYQRNGNLSALLSHLDVMQRYVDYLGGRTKDNIVAYGLGDWYDIGPGEPGVSKLTTPGVTATATYYQDLRVLQATLALAGRAQESRQYGERADTVWKAFNARFLDKVRHEYDKGSQTAQAMPLVVGLVPAEERDEVLDKLVADIQAHQNHVTSGDVGFHYVVDALMDGGHSDVLYDMLERTDSPSYGYQLTKGATSLTEAWDADPSSSQDHFMLGHAEEWFYRGLGGIQVDFSAAPPHQLVIRPQIVGKLTWVRSSFDSAWGRIESNWNRSATATEYDIEIPCNATASVQLANPSSGLLLVNGVSAEHAAGVVKVSSAAGTTELIVGSGRYRIVARAAVQ